MTTDLIITQTLRIVIAFIAVMVLVEFIYSKDGMLRKILIAFFAVEVYIYFGTFLYYTFHPEQSSISELMWLIPKGLVKIWLYLWLIKNSKQVF